MDETGPRFETSPRKSDRRVALYAVVSRTSAGKATKLLNLRLHEASAVRVFKESDQAASFL
jgi:hypothetical protein